MLLGALTPAFGWSAVPMYLPKDTPVQLRLTQSLSSAFAKVNDRVDFEVSEDVKVGEYVAIPTGSLAWGVVVEAVPRSRMMRSGKLAVDIRSVCLANGARADLRGTPAFREDLSVHPVDDGPSTNVLALPALPVLLFVYGKDVVLQRGASATAYLTEGLKLSVTELTASTPNTTCDRNPNPAPNPNVDGYSTVIIRSAPTDAELTVDGKYMGNTPSTVKLAPGDHVITAMAPGRKTWERSLHLTAGDEINVTATLEERAPIGPSSPVPASNPAPAPPLNGPAVSVPPPPKPPAFGPPAPPAAPAPAPAAPLPASPATR